MPVIAYQSFNSNSSSTHGLTNTSLQRFTKDTNTRVTDAGHQALVLPGHAACLTDAFHGPAHLRPIETLGSHQTSSVFGTQIALSWQNFFRAFGEMPAIMVYGEIDASHPDFDGVVTDPNVAIQTVSAKKACQCFTAISQSAIGAQIQQLASGEGFVAYSVQGLVVAFVHVPNRIARSVDKTQDFYRGIARALNTAGDIIHVVIGDTNQSSSEFTAKALNGAFGTTSYTNAHSGGASKFDNYNVEDGGTNSAGTKMYDVAVYRSDCVKLKSPTVYLSQSTAAVTVTDHCGLALSVELGSGS